ncbi:MAG: superinfection immunity protein [Candidatus Margulisbacteria bacterium]|nr:superinfection immunity protein [Candidatus Margulisiibacteriota bacterium]MBU1022179.1 superinfection immunity protein [Candidatus Margulisiibacteriota bacterium]MBU1729382.1 superinfection immunity protein [Candidatus Margulisiibacteriota bacterium]MBU1955655.1 superinfection immunity protein [Candidatus Margulisiibacteriota bacterium]
MDDSTLMFIAFLVIYFAPSIIAWNRKGRDGIIALNILLGWTFFG